jgi:hypothetical protein
MVAVSMDAFSVPWDATNIAPWHIAMPSGGGSHSITSTSVEGAGCEVLGEQWPELQDPSPHRFVRDIQAALSEQIFDVAIAQREADIEPNRVPDNHRRELVAGKRDCHAPSYP